jgi:serine/threonine-protein kinase
VKLIDFGVAKATDRLEQTRTDHVKGKYGYMAPEQISGLPIDHRTDVYAAGLLLHELLSGVSPFFGMNQVQILHRMTSGQAPELPRVPELKDDSVLRRVHDRALAQSPADRYQTAADFVGGLREVAEPIGGLPTNDQLAAFLSAVDPELIGRLQRKMEDYGKLDTSGSFSGAFPGSGTFPAEFGRSTGSVPVDPAGVHGSFTEPDSLTVTRGGVLAGSVLLVSLVSSIVAATLASVVLVVGFLVASRLREPAVETPPAPAPVAAPVPVAAPAPVSEPVPVAVPEPVPVAEPVPVPVVSPRPREPAPEPVVVEPEPVVVAPEPVVEPEPVVVAPEPEPVAPQPVAPVESGFLNVTAPEKGRPVLVDGEAVGATALQRHKLAVGTYTIEVDGYDCTPRTVTVRRSQVVNVTCK